MNKEVKFPLAMLLKEKGFDIDNIRTVKFLKNKFLY